MLTNVSAEFTASVITTMMEAVSSSETLQHPADNHIYNQHQFIKATYHINYIK
jgi:hypothetical protein